MWSSSGSSFVMSNNSLSESPLHSIAQYIEDYMDLVEDIPNDIARHMTQLHEYNHRYLQLMAQLDSGLALVCNKSTNELRKRKSLLKIQRNLIEVQEIADEKLILIQTILDQLDGKARQLDFDFRSVTMFNTTPSLSNNSRLQLQTTSSSVNNSLSSQRTEGTNSSANISNTINNTNNSSNDSVSKEVINGTPNGVTNDVINTSSNSGKRSSARRNTNSRSYDNNNDSNCSKRSVKRGMKSSHKEMKRSKNSISSLNNSTNSSLLMANSPTGLYEGQPIDPDEPTYCLCEQVSFGEMICCDNSECKIEWFHFSCVSLNTKPKGKWFCPNCRGDRSNIQKK